MSRRMVLASMLLGVCSCGPPNRSNVVVIGGGDAFRYAMASCGASFLTALHLCDRNRLELLAAPGESFEFGSEFVCPKADDSRDTRIYYVVGIADSGSRISTGIQKATVFPPLSPEDLQNTCKTTKTIVSELTPCGGPEVRVAFYFSTEPRPMGELLRLDFTAELRSEGTLAITCDSASSVDVCDVEFIDPPSAGPNTGPQSGP